MEIHFISPPPQGQNRHISLHTNQITYLALLFHQKLIEGNEMFLSKEHIHNFDGGSLTFSVHSLKLQKDTFKLNPTYACNDWKNRTKSRKNISTLWLPTNLCSIPIPFQYLDNCMVNFQTCEVHFGPHTYKG